MLLPLGLPMLILLRLVLTLLMLYLPALVTSIPIVLLVVGRPWLMLLPLLLFLMGPLGLRLMLTLVLSWLRLLLTLRMVGLRLMLLARRLLLTRGLRCRSGSCRLLLLHFHRLHRCPFLRHPPLHRCLSFIPLLRSDLRS